MHGSHDNTIGKRSNVRTEEEGCEHSWIVWILRLPSGGITGIALAVSIASAVDVGCDDRGKRVAAVEECNALNNSLMMPRGSPTTTMTSNDKHP